jgi:protein SCO1/2
MAETRSLRTFRIVLWSLVVVAAVAATVLFFVSQDQRNRGETTILGGPGGGEFALVDQRGAPVDRTIFTGHPSLLFFGYTHCPDVCPTTMGEMQGWFEALGEEGKTLRGVFVTVDPARDTPELLDGYVSWVSDRIVALTGEQSEIDKVVKDWGASAEKVGEGDDYLMNHTASVFLVDARGQFVGTIAYGEDTDTALGKIRRLIANSPSA